MNASQVDGEHGASRGAHLCWANAVSVDSYQYLGNGPQTGKIYAIRVEACDGATQ